VSILIAQLLPDAEHKFDRGVDFFEPYLSENTGDGKLNSIGGCKTLHVNQATNTRILCTKIEAASEGGFVDNGEAC
jgi:hypothetical protein